MTAGGRSQIGAVILAAGKSTRMGEPKQLLRLNGKPLVEIILGNVRGADVADVVLVLGFGAEAIRRAVALEDVKVIVNQDYEQGMASSLGAGLAALDPTTDAALIVLGDQPSVRPETLNRMIERYQRSDAQILVPMYQGFRGNPVLLDRSVFPEVMALKGDIGCRAVFGNHQDGIVKVMVDDIGILLDIDSMDDFAKLLRYGPRDQEPGTLLEAIDLHGRTVPEKEDSPRDSDELIIVGTDPVAIALAKLGRVLQFRVRVVAPLLEDSDLPEADEVIRTLDFSRLPIAPGCCMVIADRGRFDEEAIEQAFGVKIGYVGLVANRKRAEDLRRRLQKNGHAPEELATLHSPAGLDIGANTPEEIALSILSEIVKVKRQRAGGIAPR
jgi:molybdenum cofactor cytidylyltransferase